MQELEAHKAHSSKRIFILAAGILVSALAFLLIIGFSAFHFFVYLPSERYKSLSEGEWKNLNVQTAMFTTQNDFDRAEKTLLDFKSSTGHQRDPIPAYLLGSLYTSMDRYDDAIRAYEGVLSITQENVFSRILYEPFASDAHAALGILYYFNEEPRKALRHIALVSSLPNPEMGRFLESLSQCLSEPERAEYHYDLGVQLRRYLWLGAARNELESAVRLSLDPQSKLRFQQTLVYRMPRYYKDLPPLVRYLNLAGDTAHQQHRLKEAESLYQKAIQAAPNFEWSYHHLALVQRNLNRLEDAQTSAQKAISINPQFLLPNLVLGDIAITQNRYPQAVQYFQQALNLKEQVSDEETGALIANVENQLAFTYEQMDQPTQALAHYRRVMANVPEDSEDYTYAEMAVNRVLALAETHSSPPAGEIKVASLKIAPK